MSIKLLADNFDARLSDAVQAFWKGRTAIKLQPPASKTRQGEGRDAVVGGQNMNVFADLVREVVEHCGLPA